MSFLLHDGTLPVGRELAPKLLKLDRLSGWRCRVPRVLIVDDEENQRRTLSIGLRLDGFDVVVASSSQEALRALSASAAPSAPHANGIDLALIDLMMPGLNGLDLARQIRRSYPTVRVVLSSAYHLSARQVERADCGAVGFVPKPYQLSELCSFLRAKTKAVSPSAC
jgi:DNA-binding response OmpR family regulator